ncbi:hypothetical protein PISMIDRAFT_11524 [Pisolithus microcarpus 441]|uniref:Uncharacterized protein n=1 Tax=Pisolithus microcarpus 441 TaxID=765257 RepID=A0A0C9YCL8_9AGAM|nr:hypothetical protein PISMIDRAFT_11524 [Pisolithus microcarpus 441]
MGRGLGWSKACSCIGPIYFVQLFKRSKLSSARINLYLLTAPQSLPANMRAFPSLQTWRYPQISPSSPEPAHKTKTSSDDGTRASRTLKSVSKFVNMCTIPARAVQRMTISSTNISPISVCGRRRLAARYRRMQASSAKTELERERGVVAQTEELLGF